MVYCSLEYILESCPTFDRGVRAPDAEPANAAANPSKEPKEKDQPTLDTLLAISRVCCAVTFGAIAGTFVPFCGATAGTFVPFCWAWLIISPALAPTTPNAPDTPLDNSQALTAKVVAQRIAPFNKAVLRFIGPQVRVVIHPPMNSEINKLIMDQTPTAVPAPPTSDRGDPEPAMLFEPIAAPIALNTNCVLKAIANPAKIGPHRTRS